jgi:tetratricopeptide (TPR) repeat protein
MMHLLWIACLLALFQHFPAGPAQSTRKPPSKPASESLFVLAAAQKYETLGEWDKAEEEYLKAGRGLPPDLQKSALAGVVRMREKLRQQRVHTALASAGLLEDQDRWKDAEQSYIDLLKSDPEAEPDVAAALRRIKPRLLGPRWSESFDDYGAKIGRFLLVLAILLVLFAITISLLAVHRTRESIQLVPFTGSTDDSAKQIAFWMQRVRAELRSAALPLSSGLGGSQIMAPNVDSGFPFAGAVDLQPEMAEPPELEIGGVKLPLKEIMQFVAIPRVRISGFWFVGQAGGNAYAEVELRNWTKFRHLSLIRRAVSSTAGAQQDKDLRIFAYDVLMKASLAYAK